MEIFYHLIYDIFDFYKLDVLYLHINRLFSIFFPFVQLFYVVIHFFLIFFKKMLIILKEGIEEIITSINTLT